MDFKGFAFRKGFDDILKFGIIKGDGLRYQSFEDKEYYYNDEYIIFYKRFYHNKDYRKFILIDYEIIKCLSYHKKPFLFLFEFEDAYYNYLFHEKDLGYLMSNNEKTIINMKHGLIPSSRFDKIKDKSKNNDNEDNNIDNNLNNNIEKV